MTINMLQTITNKYPKMMERENQKIQYCFSLKKDLLILQHNSI